MTALNNPLILSLLGSGLGLLSFYIHNKILKKKNDKIIFFKLFFLLFIILFLILQIFIFNYQNNLNYNDSNSFSKDYDLHGGNPGF